MYKIGFACKYKHYEDSNLSKKKIEEIERQYNTKTTTLRWLSTKSKEEQIEKLSMIVQHNLQTLHNLQKYVMTLPENLHMFRISSDILPFYTHKDVKYFYQIKEIKNINNKRIKNIR